MRFLVFCGYDYYPKGGWNDFYGETDRYEEAVRLALSAYDPEAAPIQKKFSWWQIVDTLKNKIISSGERPYCDGPKAP